MKKIAKTLTVSACVLTFAAFATQPVSAFNLPAPSNLQADVDADVVNLTWDQYPFPAACDQARNIVIYRDGGIINSVGGQNTAFADTGLADGVFNYQIQAKCKEQTQGQSPWYESPLTARVEAVITSAPPCQGAPTIDANATPLTLWPPNGKLVRIDVSGSVSPQSNCNSPENITWFIVDEYGEFTSANETLVALQNGTFAFSVYLEASRRGDDLDGRLYTIEIDTADGGEFDIEVSVPHDQRKK